ncbi:MAG: alpha/beta hydrolase [Gammaproteobacteria bacterium]|nr:alpha/beta hydrolase [Gammaproteobacteria bacterium]
MSDDFVMCARAVRSGKFISEPGKSAYLLVPGSSSVPLPEHKISVGEWVKKLRESAVWRTPDNDPDPNRGKARGDILVFIHGYNNDQQIVMKRHRQLKSDLAAVGYKGAVMSFDWPSADSALNYLEDRHDAKITALQLVTDGIRILSKEQGPDCMINIHLLGHSTGAYVIREAFDDADDANLTQASWMVSQIALIGGDVSSGSLEQDNSGSEALYRHCVRFTNYSNGLDSVLKLSNAKRLGMAPRAGRVGLPDDIPAKAYNVDCTDYFQLLDSDKSIQNADQLAHLGSFDHSWHIGNRVFTRDLFELLKGDLDRNLFPTRQLTSKGLKLKRP